MQIAARGGFYTGVFLTCLCVMGLQIVETRLLSVVTNYHLAFFSISMAMFGMTGGAPRNVSTTLIHPGSSFRLGTAGLGSVS